VNNIEDEMGLRNLMARYADAVNRYDAGAWIGTWAEDGEWNLLGTPVRGREAILTLWHQMMGGFEFALLLPSSSLFAVQGERASGHWYLHEYNRDREGRAGVNVSRYDDTYVRRDGEWLFQSRRYTFLYNGAPDFSGTFTRPL